VRTSLLICLTTECMMTYIYYYYIPYPIHALPFPYYLCAHCSRFAHSCATSSESSFAPLAPAGRCAAGAAARQAMFYGPVVWDPLLIVAQARRPL